VQQLGLVHHPSHHSRRSCHATDKLLIVFSRRLTTAGYNCVFLQAPHLLPMTSIIEIDGALVEVNNGQRENARAWFVYSEKDWADTSISLAEVQIDYVGLDQSIDEVKKVLIGLDDDERCVILGFSQGATFCHILSMLASRANDDYGNVSPFAKISKAILLSGFPSMDQRSDNNTLSNNIRIPSLHIFGEQDTSVPKSFGEKLSQCFIDPEVYVHQKGHFIPHNKPLLDRIIGFLGLG
jgi:predicted esterase